jgi:hypothetical protein
MFKRCQQRWPYLEQNKYEVASDDMFDAHTSILRTDMITFCKVALSGSHPRDDYEEFLKISLIFLGGGEREAVSFRSPGAFHHARWIAKAIYCIKISLPAAVFSNCQGKEKCDRASTFCEPRVCPVLA